MSVLESVILVLYTTFVLLVGGVMFGGLSETNSVRCFYGACITAVLLMIAREMWIKRKDRV